jgi:hypothetical protein
MKLIFHFLLLLLLLIGCTTTSRVNWDSRIGNYTLDQASAELGYPEKTEVLPDGTRMADWLTQRGRPASVGFGMGGAFGSPGFLESPIPYESPPIPNRYLRLTFGPDGKLLAWKRLS